MRIAWKSHDLYAGLARHRGARRAAAEASTPPASRCPASQKIHQHLSVKTFNADRHADERPGFVRGRRTLISRRPTAATAVLRGPRPRPRLLLGGARARGEPSDHAAQIASHPVGSLVAASDAIREAFSNAAPRTSLPALATPVDLSKACCSPRKKKNGEASPFCPAMLRAAVART